MDFLMTAGIMLLLVLLGIPVFSAGAGFVLYPALSARVFRSLSLRMSAGMPDPEEALRRFRLWQSSCVRKEIAIRVRAGRGLLSGTLFVPKAGFPEGPDTGSPSVEKTPLRRIFIFTPEGRAFSPADFAPFLRAGFPERMAGILPDSAAPSAVFVPAPAEMFIPGRRFSFGKKESAALRLWTAFFRRAYPEAAVFLCGKGLGALSVFFAAGDASCAAQGIVADSPSLSLEDDMRKSVAGVFSKNRIPGALVFAGVRAAAVFSGCRLSRRKFTRAEKKARRAAKKRGEAFVFDLTWHLAEEPRALKNRKRTAGQSAPENSLY